MCNWATYARNCFPGLHSGQDFISETNGSRCSRNKAANMCHVRDQRNLERSKVGDLFPMAHKSERVLAVQVRYLLQINTLARTVGTAQDHHLVILEGFFAVRPYIGDGITQLLIPCCSGA